MRKIVQISEALAIDSNGDVLRLVHALCDDGTLWRLGSSRKWLLEPSIPQYDESLARRNQ